MSRGTIAYRPEIDGLRAIAVLGVIFCHGGFTWIAGGYLGVDLFFVVSGYLITAIIRAELGEGSFSIAGFYERRIRRILPALLVMMALTIPPAALLMLPDDLENFGQSLVGTATFSNNIVLLLSSGYWGVSVLFKPLMHTWSLAVEEQYYLLVPLLMALAWRIARARGVAIGIAAVTVLSFLVCLYLSTRAPMLDFLLIVSRGWQIGAGSLVALAEARLRPLAGPRVAAALALAGLAMAVMPMFAWPAALAPGLLTLIPVAGICLVLCFGGARGPAERLLTWRPLAWIGLVSYSAYLYHQPAFAFLRLTSLEEPGAWAHAALIPPIFVAAWASWRFVERPFRNRRRVATRTVLLASGLGTATMIAAGLVFHFTGGFYRNWPQLADPAISGSHANIAFNASADRFKFAPLPAAPDGRTRLLVIGDSFGRDFINMGLETHNLDPKRHVIGLYQFPACLIPPLHPMLAEAAARADFIVIARRLLPGDVACLPHTVALLRAESSARIIVMGRKSFGYNNNAVMLLPAAQRYGYHVRPLPVALQINAAARRVLPPDIYVDSLAMLGDAEGRVPVFTPGHMLISQDLEHLTRAGAAYVGGILFRHPALEALAEGRR